MIPEISVTTPTGETSKINGDEEAATSINDSDMTGKATAALEKIPSKQAENGQLQKKHTSTLLIPTRETSDINGDTEAADGTSNVDRTATPTMLLDENPSKRPAHEQLEKKDESTMPEEESMIQGEEEIVSCTSNVVDKTATPRIPLDKIPSKESEMEEPEKNQTSTMPKAEAEYRAKIEKEGWTHLPPTPPAGTTFPFTLPPQQIPVWDIPETYTPTVPVGDSDDEWADDDGYSEWGTGNGYDEESSLADGRIDYHDIGPMTDEGTPHNWEDWQDYILYAQRGNLMEVTAQMQAYFQFEPPVSLDFIMSRLCAEPAMRHVQFLAHYLPGETVTMFRARQRIQARTAEGWEAFALTEPREAIIHLLANSPENSTTRPPLPDSAPPTWSRRDDAIVNTFLNNFEHPHAALVYFGNSFGDELTLEFLSLRMAQSLHLQLEGWELRLAMEEMERRSHANGL